MSKAAPPFPLVQHLLPEAFPSTSWHQSCILTSTSQRRLRDLCSNRDLQSSSAGNAPTSILSLRLRVKEAPPVESSQQAQQGGASGYRRVPVPPATMSTSQLLTCLPRSLAQQEGQATRQPGERPQNMTALHTALHNWGPHRWHPSSIPGPESQRRQSLHMHE